ncbi:MAG: hypothetical protein PWQ22_1139 [Archaeoglobaceae archaeon]|nr:hypothetical protein [Archaeoglobaceae archaeon]MDK2876729.1 hypothetical protein [Archaeoglobaceae archaeon]
MLVLYTLNWVKDRFGAELSEMLDAKGEVSENSKVLEMRKIYQSTMHHCALTSIISLSTFLLSSSVSEGINHIFFWISSGG